MPIQCEWESSAPPSVNVNENYCLIFNFARILLCTRRNYRTTDSLLHEFVLPATNVWAESTACPASFIRPWIMQKIHVIRRVVARWQRHSSRRNERCCRCSVVNNKFIQFGSVLVFGVTDIEFNTDTDTHTYSALTPERMQVDCIYTRQRNDNNRQREPSSHQKWIIHFRCV